MSIYTITVKDAQISPTTVEAVHISWVPSCEARVRPNISVVKHQEIESHLPC